MAMFKCMASDLGIILVKLFELDLETESQIIASLSDDVDQFISHAVSWSSAQAEVGLAIEAVAKIATRWAEPAEKEAATVFNDVGNMLSEPIVQAERVKSAVLNPSHIFLEALTIVQGDLEAQARVTRDVIDKCLAKLKRVSLDEHKQKEDIVEKLQAKDPALAWALTEIERLTKQIRNNVYSCHEQRRDLLRNATLTLVGFGVRTMTAWNNVADQLHKTNDMWFALPDSTHERDNPDILESDRLNIFTLLYNSTAYQYYRQFLCSELASENGDFVQDVEHYEDSYPNMSLQERLDAANHVINKYIKDDSPRQVNIDGETRKKIIDVTTFEQDIFSAAKIAIIELLRWDSVPNFKESVYYQALMWRVGRIPMNEGTSSIQEQLGQVAFKVCGNRLLRVGSGLGKRKNQTTVPHSNSNGGIRRSKSQ